MFLGPLLHDTLAALLSATSFSTLCDGLVAGAARMGFSHVALVQHGGLPRLPEQSLIVTNYPADFVKYYLENHQYVFDPVYEVSEQLDRPFEWDEIATIVPLDAVQVALFEKAREHGLNHGVTVPLHVPGKPRASCTFASSQAVRTTPDLKVVLQIIASFGFNVALRLSQPDSRGSKHRLTRREAECTTLVALGKTDWEIGKILGLGASTVKYFVSEAKKRYGVYKRSELVARALMDAQILSRLDAEAIPDREKRKLPPQRGTSRPRRK